MITYTTNPRLTLDQVLPLYQAVEWTNYTANPDRLQAGLDGTLFMRAAYEGIYQCHLLTDQTEKTTAFYEGLGFTDVGNLAARAYTYWKS